MGKKLVQLSGRRINKGVSRVNTLAVPKSKTIHLEKCKEAKEDELLFCLKESGKRLNACFDISDEDINKAIAEVRKEWK